MIDLEAYRLIHLLGIFLLFTGLGGTAVLVMSETSSAGARKLCGMAHGIGLLLILVAGFGQLARLDLNGWPLWVWLKIGIWLCLGAAGVVIRKSPGLAKPVFFLAPILGGLAAYLVIFQG